MAKPWYIDTREGCGEYYGLTHQPPAEGMDSCPRTCTIGLCPHQQSVTNSPSRAAVPQFAIVRVCLPAWKIHAIQMQQAETIFMELSQSP